MTRDANITTNNETTTTTTIPPAPTNTTITLINSTPTTTTTTSTNTTTTTTTTNTSPIVTLPPCFRHIFTFLNRSDLVKTARVSKSWHLASSEKLWSTFKFVREKEFERIFHLLSRTTTATRYGNFITSLELIHSDKDFSINSNHIFLITMLCPNLESISITFHHTRPVAPPQVAAAAAAHGVAAGGGGGGGGGNRPHQPLPAPRLPPPLLARQHNINPLPQQQAQLHTNPISQQPPQPQQHQPPQPPLHSANLPLAHFSHNCPKLKSIRLISYKPKTDDSVYEMAKYLTSGNLEFIQLTDCTTIQSSTLCKLAMTNPQLKSVEIMGSTPISDSSLATIADRCGNHLEYLSIGNAHQLTDKSIRYIPARCNKLKQICIFNNNIERISENTLTLIITHCPNLQVLSLSDSRGLGSMFFEAVVRRVHNEILKMGEQRLLPMEGLQLLCLGGVRRDMVQSRFTQELMELSASKHDLQQEGENDDDDSSMDMSDQITHLIKNKSTKFMPKSIVIRGNTIWWKRRSKLLVI